VRRQVLYKKQRVCACFCKSEREPSSALCSPGEKEKSEVFFFGSRYTQGDKLGVSLGWILGATTTKS
jgi:hypothetical protein